MRNALIYLVVILAFGVGVPAIKGLGFFDPALLAAYACLGTIFAGPLAANQFESRPATLVEALKRLLRVTLLGNAIAIAMLVCGIATVFYRNRAAFFPPDLESLGYAMLMGLTACFALASLAAWVTVALSSSMARMVMRGVFLGLLALLFFRGQRLPDMAEAGIAISSIAAVVFILLLRRSLMRTPTGTA